MYLSTDACSTGAGGFFNGQYFHTPFPSSVLHRFGHDINTLELLAIMVALKSGLRSSEVSVWSYNVTRTAYSHLTLAARVPQECNVVCAKYGF